MIKFSSDVDLGNLGDFIDISLERGVSGFVLCNTSNSRDGLKHSKEAIDVIGRGGLSGKPIFERSLERVSFAYKHCKGSVPIIGVGGVDSGESALKMIKAGASIVELYSALVYKGPGIVRQILETIEKELVKLDKLSVSEIVGIDNR